MQLPLRLSAYFAPAYTPASARLLVPVCASALVSALMRAGD